MSTALCVFMAISLATAVQSPTNGVLQASSQPALGKPKQPTLKTSENLRPKLSVKSSPLVKKSPQPPPLPSKSQIALPGLFSDFEYVYTGGKYKGKTFRYHLFIPRDINPSERYPLLVWLHGVGEGGTDKALNLKYLDSILDDPDHVAKYRFFILVTQCPSNDRFWFHRRGDSSANAEKGDEMLTVTYEILQKTIREQPIDLDRICLFGLSSGGAGCWEMAMRHPEMFAAIGPMSSPGGDVSRAAKLTHVPIWAFHNAKDTGTPPIGDQQTVAAIEAAGGCAHLTLFPVDGHNAWQPAMRSGIADWLLAQRRGACWTPPDYASWHWWHILTVPCLLLVFVRLCWSFEQRRRRIG